MRKRVVWSALVGLLLPVAACSGDDSGGRTGTDPDTAIEIERYAEDGRTVVAGGAVQPVARVMRDGKPVSGANVHFTVKTGDGTVAQSSVTTGIDGTAGTLWLLGPEAGEQVLSARVESETVEFTATATEPEVGAAYAGREDYNEYQPGELPIILSAPHGGSLRPEEIPNRTYGATGADLNTKDLTLRVADALEALTGRRPHVIVSNLHRSKLDPNRDIEEAAQGVVHAERAWYEYHNWIETASAIVARDHGRGFYVDMHGHGHEIQRLEIGYLLSSNDLANSDDVLNQDALIDKSSIAVLARESERTFAELIRGETSLGELMAGRGYRSVPSVTEPHPDGNPYFTGGYSTVRHGSRDGGVIDGLQIEHNFQGVRDTPENRQAYAEALAEALVEFLEVNMGISLVEPAVAVGGVDGDVM